MPSSLSATPTTDSPAAAAGRRIVSTAFVRIGPDGYLTVELHGGQALVLRNVTMGPKDFCGTLVSGEKAATKYCGDYAQVATARAGGGPASGAPESAAPNPPVKPN